MGGCYELPLSRTAPLSLSIYQDDTIMQNSSLNSSANSSTGRKPLGTIQPVAKNCSEAAEINPQVNDELIGRLSPIFKSNTGRISTPKELTKAPLLKRKSALKKPKLESSSEFGSGIEDSENDDPLLKELTKASKMKKRRFVSKKPRLESISEFEDEDSEIDNPSEILTSKKTAKLLRDQKEQQLLHELRESRRNRIKEKVKMVSAPKPPKFNDAPSNSTSIDALQREVEAELARIKAERAEPNNDPNTLFFMSLAAKVATLDTATANKVTGQLWAIVCKAEEETKMITNETSKKIPEQQEEFRIVPLTPEHQIVVDALLMQEPDSIIIEKFGFTLRARNLVTLNPDIWLDDVIINLYLKIVEDKCSQTYAFDSFFLPRLKEVGYERVKDWTKKVDIFSFKYLLFPIHSVNHWTLVVGNTEKKSLVYYDSLNGSHELMDSDEENMRCLWEYLKEELRARKGKELPPWSQTLAESVPLQKNGDDCGVFVCMYSSYLSRGKSLLFDGHADVSMMRRKMVYELYTGCLLP